MDIDLEKLNTPCNKCGVLLKPDNIVKKTENVVNCVFIILLRKNQ